MVKADSHPLVVGRFFFRPFFSFMRIYFMGATMRSFFCIILLIIRCLYFFIMRFFDYLYIDNQKLWQVLRITEYGLMIYWDSFQKAYFLTFPLRQLSITILKVLHGRKMFYLLLYGILENDRLSQRTLEDIFNDSVFKILFGLETDEKVCRSSLSERLSKIPADYFRQIYDCVYDRFSECYSSSEMEQYNLIRVDSSIVSDTSGRMVEGIDNKRGKLAVNIVLH